jgi:hypothetical protein
MGDWKLLEYFEDDRVELFNLSTDVAETTDLALKLPGKAAELHDRLQRWRSDVSAQLPTFNPSVNGK